jgi:hypothetical protein
MTPKNSLTARLSTGLSLAVLAAAFSFGGPSTLRAADEVILPAMQEMVIAPIMRAMEGFEQRLAQMEVSVGALAESLTTRRIVVQQICLADDSGAQTCITKGELDSLLRKVAQADIDEPTEVAAEPSVAPAPEAVVVAEPAEPATAEEPASSTEVAISPAAEVAEPATTPEPASSTEAAISPASEPVAVTELSESAPSPAGEASAQSSDPVVVEIDAEIIQTIPASVPLMASVANVPDVDYTASAPQSPEAAAPAQQSDAENSPAEAKSATEEATDND